MDYFKVCNKDNMCFGSAKDLYTHEEYVRYKTYLQDKMNNFQE